MATLAFLHVIGWEEEACSLCRICGCGEGCSSLISACCSNESDREIAPRSIEDALATVATLATEGVGGTWGERSLVRTEVLILAKAFCALIEVVEVGGDSKGSAVRKKSLDCVLGGLQDRRRLGHVEPPARVVALPSPCVDRA